MKKHYLITEEIEKMIIGLVEKCEELYLGNVSFNLYEKNIEGDINFRITSYITSWKLIVKFEDKRQLKSSSQIYYTNTNIYTILDNKIIYESSEEYPV